MCDNVNCPNMWPLYVHQMLRNVMWRLNILTYTMIQWWLRTLSTINVKQAGTPLLMALKVYYLLFQYLFCAYRIEVKFLWVTSFAANLSKNTTACCAFSSDSDSDPTPTPAPYPPLPKKVLMHSMEGNMLPVPRTRWGCAKSLSPSPCPLSPSLLLSLPLPPLSLPGSLHIPSKSQAV